MHCKTRAAFPWRVWRGSSGQPPPSCGCCESAKGVMDVINLRGGTGPRTEEKVEEDVLRAPCIMVLDMAREMERLFWTKHNLKLEPWATHVAWVHCAKLCRQTVNNCTRKKKTCERSTCLHAPSVARELKVSCKRKTTTWTRKKSVEITSATGSPVQKRTFFNMCLLTLLRRLLPDNWCRKSACWSRFNFFQRTFRHKKITGQSSLKIDKNPHFGSTSYRHAAPSARMKTNFVFWLKGKIWIQFRDQLCSCTPRNLIIVDDYVLFDVQDGLD